MAERRTSKHKLKFPPALLALRTAYMYLFVCLSKGPAPAAALALSNAASLRHPARVRDFTGSDLVLEPPLASGPVGCSFVNVMSPRVLGDEGQGVGAGGCTRVTPRPD